MSKRLIWKLHTGGMCNQFMSMEVAIGVSKWTKRDLFIVDPIKAINLGSYGHSSPDSMTTFDMFDYPGKYKVLDSFDDVKEMEGSKTYYSQDISNSVACVDKKYYRHDPEFHPSGKLALKFQDNFTDNIIINRPIENRDRQMDTVTDYRRFFYGKTDRLFKHIEKCKVKSPYVKLARKIADDLGVFNAVHMRLGDWTNFAYNTRGIYVTDEDRMHWLNEKIKQYNIDQNKIVLCVNLRRVDTHKINPIRKEHPNITILEHFITMNYIEELNKLPKYNPVILGLLCNIVCWYAEDFWGCCGSTYTNFIHRHRDDTPKYHDVEYNRFDINLYDTTNGSLVDRGHGKYIWSRKATGHLPTWFFEMKENTNEISI
mgnify:CR=1 FL=1